MNRHKVNLGEVIGEAVTTTAILCDEYYKHPDTDKNLPCPQGMITLYGIFNNYLAKQLTLINSMDDVKKHAKNFIQIVAEENLEAKKKLSEGESNAESTTNS